MVSPSFVYEHAQDFHKIRISYHKSIIIIIKRKKKLRSKKKREPSNFTVSPAPPTTL